MPTSLRGIGNSGRMETTHSYRATSSGWLPVLGLQASHSAVISEVTRVAELAGVEVKPVAEAVLNLVEIRSSVPRVRASFHPAYSAYFAQGSVDLALPDEAEDLLELILAAGTTRRGLVIGVVGAHGGAGASCVAAWVALDVARRNESASVALVDADPASHGIDRLLAMREEPGIRWVDIRPDAGALVPGRLTRSLPACGRVRVLSADVRGAMPGNSAGQGAVAALSQVNDACVVDLSPQALVTDGVGWAILEWLDVLLVVTSVGERGVEAARAAIRRVPSGIEIVVAALGAGGGEAASIAVDLGIDRVWPIRRTKSVDKDVEHGIGVGQRKRSGTVKDIAGLVEALL